MRGEDTQQNAMFSYLSPEQRVPQDHPVRRLRRLVDAVLRKLSRRFTAMYAHGGRPSIPPRSCCAPCCCRCSTPSAASAC